MKADKETKIIMSWIGIDADNIDFDKIYHSPKFWLALIIIAIVIALIAVLL